MTTTTPRSSSIPLGLTGLLGLTACVATPETAAPAVDDTRPHPANQVSVHVGRRVFEEPRFDTVETQVALGLEFARENPAASLGWEVGVAGSRRDETTAGVELELSAFEVYAGARKSFGQGRLRPYVGFGLNLVRTELERTDGSGAQSDDGGTIGAYVHGGVGYEFESGALLGLDLRKVFATNVDYGFVETSADYGQFGLVFGWRF
ncbi:MAG: outer membrane beta-barrel protein [Planctomycetota bacterium]